MLLRSLKNIDSFSIFATSLKEAKQYLRNSLMLFLVLVLMTSHSFASKPAANDLSVSFEILKESFLIDSAASSIYSDLNADDLNYFIFLEAYQGFVNYKGKGLIENSNVITIIDFDKTSNEKRFFVVDLVAHKVLFNSFVAHGQKTGELQAKNFSNRVNSHQSSLGFYLTDNTYFGKHGLSLRLDGLEKGLNDNARDRNIVVHSADYVSSDYINKNQRLGRSWGCPALPAENYEEVIEFIKDKSLLFIYSSVAN